MILLGVELVEKSYLIRYYFTALPALPVMALPLLAAKSRGGPGVDIIMGG